MFSLFCELGQVRLAWTGQQMFDFDQRNVFHMNGKIN